MENVAPPSQKKDPKWLLFGSIAAICLIAYTLIVVFGFQYFSKSNPSSQNASLASDASSISGSVDLNGTPPTGSTIAIMAKQNGQANATPVVSSIAAVDGAVWSWNEAKTNVEYILVASLIANGKTIATSKKLVLIAPGDSEVLRINVPSQPATSQTQAAISGTFNLNGYIPPNSTITIATRQVGTNSFVNVLSNLPAVDSSIWSWTSAIQNTAYEIQATLLVNGTVQNQSQVLTVTAPATNETLAINSTATPPTPVVTGISGTININGYIPSNGNITLGVRITGTSQFNQIASNISATDGVAWSYNSAQTGTSYDIQAYLWQNGQPYSQSQILTVSAPATGEVLTINAQSPPTTTPSGNSISINCNSYSSSANLWQITVNYNNSSSITNAQQYWLTIGTNSGGNQQISFVTNPSNPNQTQTYVTGYIFNGSITYYAQYAYATCANCNSYSPFSPSLTFTCSFPPTATPVPTNTPTPTNTPIPTPTNTPMPTPTNTPIPTPTNTPTP